MPSDYTLEFLRRNKERIWEPQLGDVVSYFRPTPLGSMSDIA